MIDKKKLMALIPEKKEFLYHYTSYTSLCSIVENRCLRISHVYYMNDSNEIKYGAKIFQDVVAAHQRQETNKAIHDFLAELHDWINNLIRTPHYMFVFSLTEKGNMLSQWRAYTPHGESGISLGFNKIELEKLASQKDFHLIKCVYEYKDQLEILKTQLNAIIESFQNDASSIDTSNAAPNQKYLYYFEKFKEQLLKVFCQVKDPFFHEEQEWRMISKYFAKYTLPEIKFRPGKTTLIPYIEFQLSGIHDDGRLFEQVFVGPSANLNLAFPAVSNYLSNKKVCNMTWNSLSPLRATI